MSGGGGGGGGGMTQAHKHGPLPQEGRVVGRHTERVYSALHAGVGVLARAKAHARRL
jgi:hypothetical protein